VLARIGESETLVPHWQECKMVQPPWETVWWFLSRLKIELPYDPTILLLGIYLKELKIRYKDTFVKITHSRNFYNSQKVETTRMSINR
jgi:hypothetical protein